MMMDALWLFLTPTAVLTAIASGAALGYVIRHLSPMGDYRMTAYLAVVLGVLWYVPQIIQLSMFGGVGSTAPWGTLSKFLLYLVAFVLPMFLVLRHRRG